MTTTDRRVFLCVWWLLTCVCEELRLPYCCGELPIVKREIARNYKMTKVKKKPAVVLTIHHPDDLKGKNKLIGGSMSDGWNHAIAGQLINSLWTKHLDDDEANKLRASAVEALIGIKPQDEIEGMIAAQLIACHNASMECYRRAMLPDIPFDTRHGNLNSANKLSRTYATLARKPQPPPRQGPAEGHGRARPRPRRRTSHRRQRREPGGGFATKSKEQPHAT